MREGKNRRGVAFKAPPPPPDRIWLRFKNVILFIYIEFIEINKHKKKLQIYIQQLMAAHIIVDNGYLKIE